MTKTLLVFGLLLLVFSTAYGQVNKQEDKLIIERIKWLYQLKRVIGTKYWFGYSSKKAEVTLAYFTNSKTYIVNPDISLKNRLNLTLKYKDSVVCIFINDKRVDTKDFHMETAYDSGDSSLIYYKNPVMMCSDYETTKKFVSDVNSLQKWGSMVMHEYFHGFQFKHYNFLSYANDSISISGTKLQSFYDSHNWYKDGVDKENLLLLACLSSDNKASIKSNLKKLFAIRQNRRLMFQDSLHFDVSKQEDFLEKTEGSSRYIEWQLFKSFEWIPINKTLKKIDTAYDESTYKNFNLEREPWMYEANSIRYFYSTGFNFLRLLDKLNIEYKKNFFNDNTSTPENLLLKFIMN